MQQSTQYNPGGTAGAVGPVLFEATVETMLYRLTETTGTSRPFRLEARQAGSEEWAWVGAWQTCPPKFDFALTCARHYLGFEKAQKAQTTPPPETPPPHETPRARRRIAQGDPEDRLVMRQPNGKMRRKRLSAERRKLCPLAAHIAYQNHGAGGLALWYKENEGLSLSEAWEKTQTARGFAFRAYAAGSS